MPQRERFIQNCIEALNDINKDFGYAVISQKTLCEIVETYAKQHNSPELPGKRSKSNAPEESVMSDEVINLFNRPKLVKQVDNETDFKDIANKNADKAERIKKERLKANKGVIRSHRLKK